MQNGEIPSITIAYHNLFINGRATKVSEMREELKKVMEGADLPLDMEVGLSNDNKNI